MKKRFHLLLCVGIIWFIQGAEIQAQEKSQGLVATPAPDARPTDMSGKKNPASFEHVHALATDASGKVMFVGTHVGLFRSDGGTSTWQKVALSTKQSNFEVMAVTPDPHDPKTIYAATHEAGIFKSADGGLSWKAINEGIRGPDVHGLAVDPNSPSKLHAVVGEKGAGIYRSTNGGGKWSRVNEGPGQEIKFLSSVNISTGMGGIFLYAGTSTGLQRSPDCF